VIQASVAGGRLFAFLTCLAAASPPAEGQTTVDFRSAAAYRVAEKPNSLVVVDLDLNGHLDVAAAGEAASGLDQSAVTILLGDGSGALSHAGDAPSVGITLGMAAGRFDADALPDLILAQQESDFMWLLPNLGNGSFGAPQRITSGHDPWPVVAVDFNGDGKLDALQGLAAEVGGRVNILYGDGDGTFADPIGARSGGPNRALAIADFNGDGRLDAVVGNYNRASISVLLGREDGTLAPHLESDAGGQPAGVAVGDLDEDGILDVVASSTSGDVVTVSLGIGDGRFEPSTPYAVGDAPVGVALADFDQDGHLDVVAGNRDDGTVSLLRGHGTGELVPARTYIADRSTYAVAIGDLNEDTLPDVITVNGGELQESTATVLFGKGTTLEAVEQLDSPTPSSTLGVADVDGDGSADLVAALPSTDELGLYLSRGDDFALANIDLGTISPSALALADLDGDDRPDVVVAGEGESNLTVLMNRGSDFAAPVTLAAGGVPVGVAAADYDDDGSVDLAAALASSEVVLLRGDGAGGFSTPQRTALSGPPVALASVDIDNQGGVDVAVTLESGSLAILLGRVDTGFQRLDDAVVATSEPVSLTAVDMNGDVFDDLAIAYAFGGLQLLRGDGVGSFEIAATFTGLELPTSVVARDMTGDGRQDLMVSERMLDSVAVFAADGAGGFTGPTRIRVGDAPRAVQSGDFDGDGDYDLATSCVHPSTVINRLNHTRRGDANADGRAGAADLIAIAVAVDDVDCTPVERQAALGTDADGDGVVCRRDLRAAARRIFLDV
jgi:hypothetical protein